MLPLNRTHLLWTARYLATVPAAATVLVILRWSTAPDAAARLALIADSVWQASVWPFYLILLAVGAVS